MSYVLQPTELSDHDSTNNDKQIATVLSGIARKSRTIDDNIGNFLAFIFHQANISVALSVEIAASFKSLYYTRKIQSNILDHKLRSDSIFLG
jgi:hypothetical protein